MKRFLARTALFLVGLAGMFVLASVYYELRVRQAEDFFRQVAWFRDPAVKPTVLLIGDSRLALNVDPRRLPPGFYNFSYPGDTLRHLYLRAKFALQEKPGIRYLVLGLEDLTLSEARAEPREVSRHMLFATLADLTEVYPPSPRFLLRSAVLYYLPLVNAAQRARTAQALVNDAKQLLTGHAPRSKTRLLCGGFRFAEQRRWVDIDQRHRRAWAAWDVERQFGAANDVPEMRAVFKKILDLARRHGVRVIGVRSPLTREYITAARRYDIGATFAFFRANGLAAMLDYETLFADAPVYFYDHDHLNGRGATRFTDRLVADLLQQVTVRADAPAPCDVVAARAAPRWPYNDVLSSRSGTPVRSDSHGAHGEPPMGVERQARAANGPSGDDPPGAIEAAAGPPTRPRPRLSPAVDPRGA
jgi:hypothetical protein